MKRMRLFCTILAVLMLFSLAACGNGDTDEPEGPIVLEVGDYELEYKDACIMKDYAGEDALVLTVGYTNNTKANQAFLWTIIEYAVQKDREMPYAAVYLNDETDEMVTDSQMVEVAPGETIEIKSAFVLSDTTSEVEVFYEEIEGDDKDSFTVDPSTLSRVESGTGADLYDGIDNMPIGDIEGNPLEVSDGALPLDWWNGDWYGWWIMTGCWGYYEDMEGEWWDICGTIDIGEDGVGTVTLWDEDYTKAEPMVSASVSLSEDGTGEFGTMMSEGGWFTDIYLEHADWIVDPGLVDYPNMIHISGYYENGDDEYYYDIYLRPWGTYWDDMSEEFLPYYYNDWYLPLIEAGEYMPDSIG